jgi:hypothetical protein
MGVTGDGKDRLEVVGDDIDTVCLVKCLRKKVGHAKILQMDEVKDKKTGEEAGKGTRGRAAAALLLPPRLLPLPSATTVVLMAPVLRG